MPRRPQVPETQSRRVRLRTCVGNDPGSHCLGQLHGERPDTARRWQWMNGCSWHRYLGRVRAITRRAEPGTRDIDRFAVETARPFSPEDQRMRGVTDPPVQNLRVERIDARESQVDDNLVVARDGIVDLDHVDLTNCGPASEQRSSPSSGGWFSRPA